MNPNPRTRFAPAATLASTLAATLIAMAPKAWSQEPPLRATLVDESTVVMMPTAEMWLAGGPGFPGEADFTGEAGFPEGAGLSGAASLAGVDVQISLDGDLLTYRADYLGRTHTAYDNISGRPMNVQARDVRPLSLPGTEVAPATAKESLTPDVFMYTRYGTPSDPARVAVPFVVHNSGGARQHGARRVFQLQREGRAADRRPDGLGPGNRRSV